MNKRNLLRLIALAAIGLSAATKPSTADAASLVYVAGSGNEFGTIDLTTGSYTNIGTLNLPSGDNIFGMGFGADGKLYGLDGSLPTSNLYRIDTTNANTTLIGGINQSAIDATADASGKMYALSQDANASFYTLNPPSTMTNVVGPSGIMGTGLMAVNAAGTQIFAGALDATSNSTDLYSINPTTGAATLIGDTGFLVINGLFVNGTLYAFQAPFNDATGALVPGKIVTIDTTTGVGTFVANYAIPDNHPASDTDAILASAVAPQSIPEPSSVVLGLIAAVTAGSVSLLRRRRSTPAI
jgi:hypothetical protein